MNILDICISGIYNPVVTSHNFSYQVSKMEKNIPDIHKVILNIQNYVVTSKNTI